MGFWNKFIYKTNIYKIIMKNKKLEKIVSILVAVVVIGGLSFFLYQKSQVPGEYDELAQCLSESGVVMYGAWWCPHCKAQKEEFGKSFKFINYVECASGRASEGQNQKCDDAGIKGYPTWKFVDGTVLEGEQSPNKLAKIVQCETQK